MYHRYCFFLFGAVRLLSLIQTDAVVVKSKGAVYDFVRFCSPLLMAIVTSNSTTVLRGAFHY